MDQAQFDALPLAERKAAAACAVVQCPVCHTAYAWLGDQGACIHLHGQCMACLLFMEYPTASIDPLAEAEADAKIAAVIAEREARERWTGFRVFPCFDHRPERCPTCHGRDWVLGYPPGAGAQRQS